MNVPYVSAKEIIPKIIKCYKKNILKIPQGNQNPLICFFFIMNVVYVSNNEINIKTSNTIKTTKITRLYNYMRIHYITLHYITLINIPLIITAVALLQEKTSTR